VTMPFGTLIMIAASVCSVVAMAFCYFPCLAICSSLRSRS
jgi:hypothetical protein